MLKVAGGIILAIVVLTVVVPVMCGVCVIGGGAALVEKAKEEKAQQRAEAVSESPTSEAVTYQGNCTLRSGPSTASDKIGLAVGGTAYPVLEAQGRWKRIAVDGVTGWAGCRDTL